MAMHKASHPGDNVDKLYVLSKEGGRTFTSIENSIDPSTRGHENYIKKGQKILIKATRNSRGKIKDQQNNSNKETEMGRKTTQRIVRATNKRNLTLQVLYMAKKEKL